jgi:hypothetical protein
MEEVSVILRWNDGAIGLTGWGWLVFWFLVWSVRR